MQRLIFTSFLFLVSIVNSEAQNESSIRRYSLDSVVVKEKLQNKIDEVTVGTRVSTISSVVLSGNQTKSLSELLSDNTMVYIKSLGQGALATSSFRGTSSGHTQVNWNGISINPAMSGSFDFSQIPVFFADNVSLYHGSGHLKGGTGALGGSVNINNSINWHDTTKFSAFTEAASYDTYTAAASVMLSGKSSRFRTRLYYQESDNDYRYINKVLRLEDFYESREEANYYISGIMQEAYLRLPGGSTLSANLWLQYGDRRLPQPIIVNVTQHEKQEDIGIKSLVEYHHSKKVSDYSIKAAYLSNSLDYDKWFDSDYFPGEKSRNRSQSLHLTGDYETQCSDRLNLSASVKYSYDFVNASSYSENSVSRSVLSTQGGALWRAFAWLTANGHLMVEMNDGEVAPTFSVGLSSDIITDRLTAKASASYNYKFPNLNDLYWQPGGNPDLVPEQGFSYDATICYTPKIGDNIYLKSEVTAYMMNIDNWIMWLPTMNWYWEPRNVQNVLSYGVELLNECNIVIDAFRAKLSVNYTYSPSINRERNFEEDNTYHKQLPYIPLHKANARLAFEYGKYSFSYQVSHTGKRFTSSDESYSTRAYTVHDLELKMDYLFKGRYRLTPKLRVNNLFDAYYESTQYYPMPLRIISIGLAVAI